MKVLPFCFFVAVAFTAMAGHTTVHGATATSSVAILQPEDDAERRHRTPTRPFDAPQQEGLEFVQWRSRRTLRRKSSKSSKSSSTAFSTSSSTNCEDGGAIASRSGKSSKSRRRDRRRKLKSSKSRGGGDDDDDGADIDDDEGEGCVDEGIIGLLTCNATTPLPTGAELSVELNLNNVQGIRPVSVSEAESSEINIRRSLQESRIGQASITDGGVVQKFATFVYVVDVSGSTSSACGNGVSVLQCEKDAVKSLNGNITGVAINVGLVSFASGASAEDVDDETGVQTLAAPDDPGVTAAIDGLRSGGGTNIGRGIRSAIDLVQQSIDDPSTNVVETVIIVITDGQFSYSPDPDIETLKTLGTRVYTFAIGSGSSCVQPLDDLAAETGTGQCNRVVEAQDLGLTFDEEFVATRTIDSVSVTVNDAVVGSSTEPSIPASGLLPQDSPTSVDALLGFGGSDGRRRRRRQLRRVLQEEGDMYQEVCLSATSRTDVARCCVNVTAPPTA